MWGSRNWVGLFIFILRCLHLTLGSEFDLTVDVGAGREECFFESVKKPMELEVEYQVIDGGDMDINFMVQAPDGRVLISETQKTDGVHKIDAISAGDYKLCFDNSFSMFARKTIFFELSSDVDDEDDDEDDEKSFNNEKEELAVLTDMKLEDFKKLMDNVKHNLDRSEESQQWLRNNEARDRNTQESNFQRVNFLSGIQLFIMIGVGLTQVILIRSLFDDKSRISGQMKAKT